MRPSRQPLPNESEDFNPWISYTDLMSGSLLILSLLTFFSLIFLTLSQKQIHQLRGELQHRGTPPIIFIPDEGKFRFPTGSAQLSAAFRTYIRQELAKMAANNRKAYGIDTIEIIGHTDGQPNQGRSSNLDFFLEQAVATNALGRLTPGSNADLGLLRALAIANELRSLQKTQPALQGLYFRAYSAGQLYRPDGNFAAPNRNPDASRRRIEVRFTRMPKVETAR